MAGMRIFDSQPALRWLAPVAVLALVGGTGVVAATATAQDKLPDRSVQLLLEDLQQPQVDGMSGTVVQKANLGIPDLPGRGGGTSATSMMSGSHTLRVWYANPGKARVALVDTGSESDVVTNGTDVWTWSSQDKAATHRTIPATEQSKAGARQAPAGAPKTPQEAAQWALDRLSPSTDVTPASDVTVAGQQAYELVLRPKSNDSLLTDVKIAIDGVHHVPLRVEAYAGSDQVFKVAYSSVSFTKPEDAQFSFNPPPDTKVTQVAPSEHTAATPAERNQAKKQAEAQQQQTKTVGTGWSTVVVTKLPSNATQGGNEQLQGFLKQLTPVSGTTWGSGRLLQGTAFSAVLTDDNRLAVGSVKPELLYQALKK